MVLFQSIISYKTKRSDTVILATAIAIYTCISQTEKKNNIVSTTVCIENESL